MIAKPGESRMAGWMDGWIDERMDGWWFEVELDVEGFADCRSIVPMLNQ